MALTILGGAGFVGSAYVNNFYHHAVGNIAHINDRSDYQVHSEDVLYLISTVDNYNVFTDVHLDVDTNLTTLLKVLDSWKSWQKFNVKKGVFNFISSWSVYGNQGLNVDENSACDPKGFYIITKRCAEQLLQSYCETFDLQYRILRLGNVVGSGDAKTSNKKNILQHNINLLAEGKNVELYGDGRFFRDFIHVDDVAKALELVMCKGNCDEIYNIGNGLPYRYYIEILEYVQNVLGSTGKIILKEPTSFQKRVPVGSFYMNNQKLESLGYRPEYTGEKLWGSLLPSKRIDD